MGRKGGVKKHLCFRIHNSPGSLYFPSGLPRRQGVPPAPTGNPAPRNSPDQPGLSGDFQLAGLQSCRGDRGCLRGPLLGADISLRVERYAFGEANTGSSPRRPKSGVEGLRSAGVAPAQNLRRAGAQAAHSCRGLCSPRPPGGAAPPLWVPLRAAAQPSPLPGAPSPPAPGARQPRPLSPAPAAACLCCFLSLDRLPEACSPGIRPGVGGLSPLELHAPAAVRAFRRACTGLRRLQRAAARMHRPLLLLLRAPGVGGGEGGEQRQPRR